MLLVRFQKSDSLYCFKNDFSISSSVNQISFFDSLVKWISREINALSLTECFAPFFRNVLTDSCVSKNFKSVVAK